MRVEYKSLEFLGYPRYRVGEDGSVWKYSKKRKQWRVLKPKKARGNYDSVALYCNAQSRYFMNHRLVLEAFVGPCPDGLEACHNDGNPQNNKVNNLRWDTRESNMSDKLIHGTSRRGKPRTWVSRAELTLDEVKEILKRYENGEKIRQLERVYEVSYDTIRNIVRGISWRNWL